MRNGLAVLCTTLAVLLPIQATAQEPTSPPLRNVVSANPFLLIATWFNAEYERAITVSSTVGIRVSTVSLGFDDDVVGNDDDAEYYSGRVFWRYYPNEAYRGFFFGLDAGVTSVDDTDETHTVGGAGFELGYGWLLGRRRNFYISIGAGADRLFGSDLADAPEVIPTVRILNIGFAF